MLGREKIDQFLANIIVHFRQHVGGQHVAEHRREHRALVGARQLEQVGDVGGVEAADPFARGFAFAGFGQLDHVAYEFGPQPVVFVEFGVGFACRLFAVAVIGDDNIFRRQGFFAFVHRAVLPESCGVRAFP